jgi:hypothetical protein
VATLADLEAAIEKLLAHPLGVGYYQLVRPVAEKAYEAYVFGLCLRAVRELGETPKLRGIDAPPRPFVFRGAPGQIHSRSRNYGYAAFSLNSEEFEIHVGVEFQGTSGMTHELDVCIMRAEDARACRQQPEDPPARSLVAGWECKFYAGRLPKALGRAFVGLIDDMGTNMRMSGLCSNSEHPQLRRYLKPQRRPNPSFRLTPLEPSNEAIFVNQVKGELKKLTAS